MKKLLTMVTVLLLLAGAASAQFPPTKVGKKNNIDSISKNKEMPDTMMISDSLGIIAMRDIRKFDLYLQDKFTVQEYKVIMSGINQMVNDAVARYYKREKGKKP